MKLVKTKDNSYTFYNEEYEEWYHSVSGALEEANEKYVKPLAVHDNQTILDVCFGLGYNSYAAMKVATKLKIIGLENDPEVLKAIQDFKIDDEYEIIKKVAREHKYKDDKYDMTLLIGDATKTIKNVEERVDLVFFDPFSPKKCPELWTKEFFKDVHATMKKGAKLATYSCARLVRDNMKAFGFEVIDGPKIHRRGPSTIAIKN